MIPHHMFRTISVNSRKHVFRSLTSSAATAPKLGDQQEWNRAKPFSEIPGPSLFQMINWFRPKGRFDGLLMTEIQQELCNDFGNIFKFRGTFGKEDLIFTLTPEDCEKVFRTEGVWPIRRGNETFVYFREKVRPDLFKGVGGLLTEQGKEWHDIRTVVNPILMQPRATKVYIPRVDAIAREFVEIIKDLLDHNHETPANFGDYVNRWSLESISCIALDTRLKVMHEATQDANAKIIIQMLREFMELSYKVEVLPSLWKYYQTPMFKKLMSTADALTNVVIKYVEEAMERLEKNPTKEESEQGVLEKLMKVDKHIAKIMAFDMLNAAVDTTSVTLIAVMHMLATNPEKQDKLRVEINQALPSKDTPFTVDNMQNLPYLRAVIKETLRLRPAVIGTMRATGQDLVIQGYQIPKGTNVIASSALLALKEENFPRNSAFLPERWLREETHTADCPNARNSNPFVYLPFGFGARMCVGKRFADLELEILTARLVQQYQIEWHHDPIKYKSTFLNTPVGDLKFQLKEIN